MTHDFNEEDKSYLAKLDAAMEEARRTSNAELYCVLNSASTRLYRSYENPNLELNNWLLETVAAARTWINKRDITLAELDDIEAQFRKKNARLKYGDEEGE